MENKPISKYEIIPLMKKTYSKKCPIPKQKTNPFQGSLHLPLTIVLLCVSCAIGILVTLCPVVVVLCFCFSLSSLMPRWQIIAFAVRLSTAFLFFPNYPDLRTKKHKKMQNKPKVKFYQIDKLLQGKHFCAWTLSRMRKQTQNKPKTNPIQTQFRIRR